MSVAIQESINYLKQFNLHLEDDLLENDLKLIDQIPAIAVIGLVSRGKSTLINKLVGEDIMPTDPNPESYGCAFLTTGIPVAHAILKTDAKKSLPTNPSAFRESIKRSPATLNAFENCSYQGALRLPHDVMLIDTKGLSEINANFDDDLAGLDRSWAAHGAIAAVLVTSVPPGVSADDVRLFQSVHRHFDGRVLVVVKQTDSSITNEDLQETAQVWRQHGPNVVVVNDAKPSISDTWGSGPLAGLENQITKFWDSYDLIRSSSITRLTNAIENLSKQIPVSFDNSMPIEKYRKLIRFGHENQNLLQNVRAIATDRMILDYQNSHSSVHSIGTLKELDYAFFMTSIGSTHARNLISHAVDPFSPIRKNIGLGEIAEVIWTKDKRLFAEMFKGLRITSHKDIVTIARAGSKFPEIYNVWSDLGNSTNNFLDDITNEHSLMLLFDEAGEAFAVIILIRIIEVWRTWVSKNISNAVPFEKIASLIRRYKQQLNDADSELSEYVNVLSLELEDYVHEWDTNAANSHAPFSGAKAFNEALNRLETTYAISQRINALADFNDAETRSRIFQLNESLKTEGTRRIWLSTTSAGASSEVDSREKINFALKWLAIAGLITALVGLAKGGGFIVLGVGVFCFALITSFLHSINGSAWVKAYNPSVPAKTTQRKTVDLSLWAGSWIALIALIAVIFSGKIDARLHSNSEVSSPVIDTYEPSQSTYAPETTPLITTPAVTAFSISDVTADGFTEDGEEIISEYSLPIEGYSELKYRMAVTDDYETLPGSYRIKACWQQASIPDLKVSCNEISLTRIGKNNSGTLYETVLLLKPNGPTGRWWLNLEFLDTSTSITSPTSLILLAPDEYTTDTSVDALPSSSTSTPQPSSYIDQSAISYANAMARWTSSGFQEMMNLSESNSPAWKYAFHLYTGRLSEIQAGRKDGSQVKTKTAGSGIRICLTSACSTLLDDFETFNGRLYDFTINGRLVSDSVITNSDSGSWVCGSFGACAILRTASWFGGTVYVNLEIQLRNSAAGTATRAAVVLVPPSGGTKAFTAGTTPTASISQNAHYLVAFPYTSSPWPGSVRVKIRTDLGTETLQVPLFNP